MRVRTLISPILWVTYVTYILPIMRVLTRDGEPEPVRAEFLGSLEPEPEPLEKKPGAGAGARAAWKKSQELEPLKIWPAPQPCEKIKSIRKLLLFFK